MKGISMHLKPNFGMNIHFESAPETIGNCGSVKAPWSRTDGIKFLIHTKREIIEQSKALVVRKHKRIRKWTAISQVGASKSH